jgi:hypothetical protein
MKVDEDGEYSRAQGRINSGRNAISIMNGVVCDKRLT